MTGFISVFVIVGLLVMMYMTLLTISKISNENHVVIYGNEKVVFDKDEINIKDCTEMNDKHNFYTLIENGQVVDFIKE